MTGDEAVAFITALIDAGAHLVDPDGPLDPGYQVATVSSAVDPPRAVDRGNVQEPTTSAHSSDDPQSDAGDQADPTTVAPGDPCATQAPPTQAHTRSLSESGRFMTPRACSSGFRSAAGQSRRRFEAKSCFPL